MKLVMPVLVILGGVAVVVSLAWFYLVWSFPGGGNEVSAEQRVLPPFTRIAINGFADVTLVQGTAESASIEESSKNRAQVRTRVSNGTLIIENGRARRWWSDFFGGGARPARVTITVRDLEAIDASGAVRLRAERLKVDKLKVSASGATSIKIDDLDAKELSVNGSGAMKIDVAGRAGIQRVGISGAGYYRAAELVSEEARVSVSGAGRVVIQVEKILKVALSGAGSVEYSGNPTVTQSISGPGRVKRRDAGQPVQIIA